MKNKDNIKNKNNIKYEDDIFDITYISHNI